MKMEHHRRDPNAFVTKLEEIPDGCAEYFPFELIEELKQEYLSV